MLVQRPKKTELTAASRQSRQHCNRAAGVVLFLSYSTAKAQFLSFCLCFFFFFPELVMLHLDFLIVCFEEERGNSLPHGFRYWHHTQQVGIAGYSAGKGAALGGGEGRGAAEMGEKHCMMVATGPLEAITQAPLLSLSTMIFSAY